MTTFQWALAGAALVLFLYAMRVFARGPAEDERASGRSLGCGFGLLAGTIWTFTFAAWLDDGWAGFRLALGLLFLLPVAAWLLDANRVSVLRAVLSTIIGVLLIGSVAPRIRERVDPPQPADTVAALEARIAELRDARAKLEGLAAGLESQAFELRARIEARGHASFEELREDPVALALLRELAGLDERVEETTARIASVEALLPELEAAVREAQRRLLAEEALPEETLRLLEETRPPAASPDSATAPGERELRELFERDF